MKKLTAGIFSVLMGLVSVNAAEAAVASKGYVDAKIGDVEEGKTVVEMINSVSSGSTQVTDALAGRVTDVEGAIETLNGAATEEGSVAKQIADAISGVTANETADAGSFISSVTQTDGKVTIGTTPFKDQIVEGETSVNAPTAVAVKTYVDAQVSSVSTISGARLDEVEQDVVDLTTVVSQNKTAADTGIQEAKDAAASALADAQADATAKANAAQAAAEATAAADATAKADAAQAAAEATAADALGAAKTELEGKIQAAQSAATYDDTQVKADIAANAGDISTIKGEQTAQNSAIAALQESLAAGGATADAIAEAKKAGTDANSALEAYKTTNDAAIADEIAARKQGDLDAIATAGTNADTKISNLNLEALSRVPVDCQDPDAFCVLTAKGGMFYWEAIERAAGEAQPTGTAIPPVTQ